MTRKGRKPTAGMTGRKHTAETLAKMRAAALGRKNSEETRAKMRAAKSNMSDETRAKIRAAALGRKHSEETRDKLRAAALTEETRGKMRAAKIGRLGKKHSEETRAKIRAAALRRCWSDTFANLLAGRAKNNFGRGRIMGRQPDEYYKSLWAIRRARARPLEEFLPEERPNSDEATLLAQLQEHLFSHEA